MKQGIKKIIFISTFPPRECGIATFTKSLVDSIKESNSEIKSEVVAVDIGNGHKYPQIVKKTFGQENVRDYEKAAEFINKSDADIISLQHEFWIYGGFNGRKIIELLKRLQKPVVITLHSVPIHCSGKIKINPDRYKSRTKLLREIFPYVKSVIVMTDSAKEYLIKEFDILGGKVFVIPHGAPTVSDEDIAVYVKQKQELGFSKNDLILTTFGLISPKKGLEYVIKALPHVLSNNPHLNVKYLIAGEMRPGKSDKYLSYLRNLTRKLKLENNVIFDSRYLGIDEIFRYLANSDIFITPYYKKEQTSSGTLSYAMAAGCCVVSTPYLFAKDLIKNNKIGELVEFKDSKSIEKSITGLVKNQPQIEEYRKNSYQVGKSIEFKKVAGLFVEILNKNLI